jgi:single-stranded-DNA-specific exonuclease
MNQKVLEYSRTYGVLPVKMDKFYTQYSTKEFAYFLPYFSAIEIFTLRLLKAKLYNEKICIYSDYDTDAITSTASMYWCLLALGYNSELITFYTPDRFLEGYGINPEAIKEISKTNDLIISVDCGVNSTIEATWLKNNSKCELIITDHHQLLGDVPDCICVINPQFQPSIKSNTLSKEQYNLRKVALTQQIKDKLPSFHNPFEEFLDLDEFETKNNLNWATASLTGVGVSFFATLWLGYVLSSIDNIDQSVISKLNYALGFVAIGTIADCQSVVEQTNRSLIRAGLKLLSNRQIFGNGLIELINQSYLKSNFEAKIPLVSSDIGYTISPILNASGRISHASLSISLLIHNNSRIPFAGQNDQIQGKDVAQLASELIKINNDRKDQVKAILAQVSVLKFDNDNVIWIKGPWSKGLVGLIASKLVNEFDKPVAVFEEGEDHYSCSMRAPEGYNLSQLIKDHSDLIIKGGGHKQAAGMTIDKKYYNQLKELFNQDLAIQKSNLNLVNTIEKQINVDSEEELLEIANELNNFEPFGIDFPFPDLIITLKLKNVLYFSEGKHARLVFDSIEGIIFNEAKKYDFSTYLNKLVTLSLRPKKDVFRGQIKTTFIISNVLFDNHS